MIDHTLTLLTEQLRRTAGRSLSTNTDEFDKGAEVAFSIAATHYEKLIADLKNSLAAEKRLANEREMELSTIAKILKRYGD